MMFGVYLIMKCCFMYAYQRTISFPTSSLPWTQRYTEDAVVESTFL